jgi:hypothetical protein
MNSPTPKQGREAIGALNRLITNLWGDDAGERLNDWPLGSYGRESGETVCWPLDHIRRPNINRRLLATNDAAITVYLTLGPQDGSRMGIVDPFSRLAAFPVTIDGNGRTIENAASVVLNTNGASREWFYRADLGGWKKLSDLTAADDMPFPSDFDELFSIALAVRLAPRYGKEIAASSISIMQKQRQAFVARYLQSQPLEVDDSISWPFMSRQGYDTQRAFSSRRAFNRGNYRG